MKQANILVSVIAFFTIFFIFCGFAIDFSMIVSSRAQLQTTAETAVLSAVSDISQEKAQNTVEKIISYSKTNGTKYVKLEDIKIKKEQNAIYIKLTAPAQTYFLSALGIKNIEIQAQAASIIEPYPLESDKDFELENHLQFVSPVLIIDKNGDEIEITNTENTSDYLVYVGLKDKINNIKWVEITCSSSDSESNLQRFDLNADCIKENNNGGISAASYLRIINNDVNNSLSVEKVNLTNIAKLIRSSKFETL